MEARANRVKRKIIHGQKSTNHSIHKNKERKKVCEDQHKPEISRSQDKRDAEKMRENGIQNQNTSRRSARDLEFTNQITKPYATRKKEKSEGERKLTNRDLQVLEKFHKRRRTSFGTLGLELLESAQFFLEFCDCSKHLRHEIFRNGLQSTCAMQANREKGTDIRIDTSTTKP
jgi:hypothetical protein